MTVSDPLLPPPEEIRICFAHTAYDMKPVFDEIRPGLSTFQVSTYDELRARLHEADVLVASGLWRNDLLEAAPRLRYLQSVSAGTNQYDLAAFAERQIMLASGSGVNMNAVSEHALGLLLAVSRRLALARDNQAQRVWRFEQRDPAAREDELANKTMVLVGLGRIGARIARLARAFDMTVIGVRKNPNRGADGADEVRPLSDFPDILPTADVVVLACPLTEDTRDLIGPAALSLVKPSAILVNVARGGCVDEAALVDALRSGRLAGAGLDVTRVEPLPEDSPLWHMPNVVLTPHAAGETRLYELNVIDILQRNLDRLWSGNTSLLNRIA